jgi:hypothetical protein
MALEVIGTGFGRTGTLSLKLALERLGFERCYHMVEVQQTPAHADVWRRAHRGESIDWDALFEGYRAAVDWPSCNLWREQLAHFPEARVLHTRRDPDRWYESVMSTIYPTSREARTSDDPAQRAFGHWADEIVWQHVFEGRMEDRAHVIGVFERHDEAVRREVPADRLLVFEASQGWEPLCAFLEVDVPDEPYPRTNTREQWREHGAPTG